MLNALHDKYVWWPSIHAGTGHPDAGRNAGHGRVMAAFEAAGRVSLLVFCSNCMLGETTPEEEEACTYHMQVVTLDGELRFFHSSEGMEAWLDAPFEEEDEEFAVEPEGGEEVPAPPKEELH